MSLDALSCDPPSAKFGRDLHDAVLCDYELSDQIQQNVEPRDVDADRSWSRPHGGGRRCVGAGDAWAFLLRAVSPHDGFEPMREPGSVARRAGSLRSCMDECRQQVAALEEQLDDQTRKREPPGSNQVADVLEAVRKHRDVVQLQHPSTALDGVQRAKERIDDFRIAPARRGQTLEPQQRCIDLLQELVRLVFENAEQLRAVERVLGHKLNAASSGASEPVSGMNTRCALSFATRSMNVDSTKNTSSRGEIGMKVSRVVRKTP